MSSTTDNTPTTDTASKKLTDKREKEKLQMSGTATIVNDHVRVKLSINLSKKIQEKIESGQKEAIRTDVKMNQLDRIDEEETSKCSENVSDAQE